MRGLVGLAHSIVEYKHGLVHALQDLVHALKVSCLIAVPGQLHLDVVLDARS